MQTFRLLALHPREVFDSCACPKLALAAVNFEHPMFGAMLVIAEMTPHLRERLSPLLFGLFFKVGLCVADPFVLFFRIGGRQFFRWTLHG